MKLKTNKRVRDERNLRAFRERSTLFKRVVECPLCNANLLVSFLELAPSWYGCEVRCTSCNEYLSAGPARVRLVAMIAGFIAMSTPAVIIYNFSGLQEDGRLLHLSSNIEILTGVFVIAISVYLFSIVSGYILWRYGKLVKQQFWFK